SAKQSAYSDSPSEASHSLTDGIALRVPLRELVYQARSRSEPALAGTPSGDPLLSHPIIGFAACCARAASGHAAAPPRSVMNARLLTRSPRRRARVARSEW